METKFKVGDIVVCTDNSSFGGKWQDRTDRLQKGVPYIVCGHRQVEAEIYEVHLKELTDKGDSSSFREERFVKIEV